MCRVPLDMGGGVKSCDLADPYILILLVDGTVALLWLEEVGGDPSLQFTWPELAKGAGVSLISAYSDATGLFVTSNTSQEQTVKKGEELRNVVDVKEESRSSMDEEDELLYGGGDISESKPGPSNVTSVPLPTSSFQAPPLVADGSGSVVATCWFCLAREDGTLEIYQLNRDLCTLVFCVRNFSAVPHTLKDSGPQLSE